MKTVFALALTFVTAFAAPLDSRQTAPTFNFALSNDVSGANAPGTILAGQTIRLGDTFGNTNLAKNGRVIATSAQLTTVGQNAHCTFYNAQGVLVAVLRDQATFAELDGVPGKAVETDVTDFTLSC